ncbi:alginate export family protein [Rhodocytophaga aerolata]|uniref:Alginate export family protein n=1 Tax=Rhodocytophaga aerolata TaxID=455078 RepID=A0ABT8R3S6_9BACT|nr:alginate export family protein [Rhodocytophaga aerolata]MDO1446752.1 alginate export family protein [Rhodocytophaga aerolata]
MQKKLHSQLLVGLVFLLLCCSSVQAQFSLTGQLRTRSELRDGQGTLSGKKAVPAFFTSQRTRLNFGYTGHRFKLFTAVQDVRVWGQDASSINRTTVDANDGLLIHEAWGEIMLLDTSAALENLSLKIGRQELVYDDVRLLGNLDWLQQGRRHDLALLKLEDHGWMAHLGVAFNQNRELKSGGVYNGTPSGYAAGTNGIGALYKSMQFLYLGRKLQTGNASFLFLKDDFNKYHMEEATKVYDRGVWSRFTTGAYLSTTALKKISLTASAYYQGGKDKDGKNMNAYLLSAYTLYPVSKNLNIGPGIDFTSGNSGSATGNTNRQFDPLYGTPHKFWGTMDYFYVADGFGKNGLVDYYLRSRYKASSKLLLSLDAHQFTSSNKVTGGDGVELDRNFGTELDFTATYSLTKIITIEGGYSSFFATPTLASSGVKNVNNAGLQANWAYLMINIKPDFFSK